jgi:hypothetical protein
MAAAQPNETVKLPSMATMLDLRDRRDPPRLLENAMLFLNHWTIIPPLHGVKTFFRKKSFLTSGRLLGCVTT